MSSRGKLFLILWVAGMAGVLSLLLIDFSGLIASLPLPADGATPTLTPAMKLLAIVQPAVILSLAILCGVVFAPKVGLSSPMAEAASVNGPLRSALKPQIIPGFLGGLAGGAAIVLAAQLGKPHLPPEVVARIGKLGSLLPLPTRLLYGGITEELLLRWGFMTLLVWAAWRIFQKGQSKPNTVCMVSAILVSSLAFGIGHLPLAFLLSPERTPAYVAFVVVANSVFGVIAGFLYWRRGLESAVIAHMIAHVELLAASYLGAYF